MRRRELVIALIVLAVLWVGPLALPDGDNPARLQGQIVRIISAIGSWYVWVVISVLIATVVIKGGWKVFSAIGHAVAGTEGGDRQ